MKKNNLCLLLILCLFVVSSCKKDEPLILELDDKVLWDNEYVKANTKFTEEQAVESLKSAVWFIDPTMCAYDNKQMVKIKSYRDENIYYKFYDKNIFKISYNEAKFDGQEFEYKVKGKHLTMRRALRDIFGNVYSEYTIQLDIVGIGMNFIIVESNGIDSDIRREHPELNEDNAKTRGIWWKR